MDNVHASLNANVGNFTKRYCRAFELRRKWQQIRWSSLLTGVAKPDLLQLITTEQRADHHPRVGPAGAGLHRYLGGHHR